MLTRCPACQTAFRISNAQLQARRGLVRCGHCQTPFDARQHLIETDAQAKRGAPASTPAPLADSPEKPATVSAPPDTADKAGTGSAADFFLADNTDAKAGLAAPSDFWSVDLPPHSPQPRTRREPADAEQDAFGPAESERVETLNEKVDFWLPPPSEPPAPQATAAGFADRLAQAERQRRAEQTPLPAEPPPPDTQAPLPSEAAPRVDGPAPQPDFLKHPARPRNGKPPHFAWAVGAGALSLTLLAQGLLLSRHEIAMRWPSLRAQLVHLCVTLHCDLPLPRKKDQIVLESSDLHPQPGQPARYRLEAQIRNRAPHVQAYPHIELTLTDARDRPIARRVLSPEEWLSGQITETGMASQQRVDVALDIETRDLQAVGYRLYVFYP